MPAPASVASTGHKLSPVVFEDIHFRSRPYHKWTAYGQAKTANSLFAVELDRWDAADGKGLDDLLAAGKMPTPLAFKYGTVSSAKRVF